MHGDSYSFDMAESKYDNQITLPPTNVKGKGLHSKTTFVIKKVILVLNYNIQCKIMKNVSIHGILTT
jgi:hypothetical protein